MLYAFVMFWIGGFVFTLQISPPENDEEDGFSIWLTVSQEPLKLMCYVVLFAAWPAVLGYAAAKWANLLLAAKEKQLKEFAAPAAAPTPEE